LVVCACFLHGNSNILYNKNIYDIFVKNCRLSFFYQSMVPLAEKEAACAITNRRQYKDCAPEERLYRLQFRLNLIPIYLEYLACLEARGCVEPDSTAEAPKTFDAVRFEVEDAGYDQITLLQWDDIQTKSTVHKTIDVNFPEIIVCGECKQDLINIQNWCNYPSVFIDHATRGVLKTLGGASKKNTFKGPAAAHYKFVQDSLANFATRWNNYK